MSTYDEIEKRVQEKDYFGALEALGNDKIQFTVGDGSWTEWIYQRMHFDQGISSDTAEEFLKKVSSHLHDNKHWPCYMDLCQSLSRPVQPNVYYAQLVAMSPHEMLKSFQDDPNLQDRESPLLQKVMSRHYPFMETKTTLINGNENRHEAPDQDGNGSSPVLDTTPSNHVKKTKSQSTTATAIMEHHESQQSTAILRLPPASSDDDNHTRDEKKEMKEITSPSSSSRKDVLRLPPSTSYSLEQDLSDFGDLLDLFIQENSGKEGSVVERKDILWFLQELQWRFQRIQSTNDSEVDRLRQRVSELETQLQKLAQQHNVALMNPGDKAGQDTKEWANNNNNGGNNALAPNSKSDALETIQKLENEMKRMKHNYEMTKRADQARIRYLEQMLYQHGNLSTSSSTALVVKSDKTNRNKSDKSTSFCSADEFQQMALALERSEDQRAQALEDLQMERCFYAEKVKQLQAALRQLMDKGAL